MRTDYLNGILMGRMNAQATPGLGGAEYGYIAVDVVLVGRREDRVSSMADEAAADEVIGDDNDEVVGDDNDEVVGDDDLATGDADKDEDELAEDTVDEDQDELAEDTVDEDQDELAEELEALSDTEEGGARIVEDQLFRYTLISSEPLPEGASTSDLLRSMLMNAREKVLASGECIKGLLESEEYDCVSAKVSVVFSDEREKCEHILGSKEAMLKLNADSEEQHAINEEAIKQLSAGEKTLEEALEAMGVGEGALPSVSHDQRTDGSLHMLRFYDCKSGANEGAALTRTVELNLQEGDVVARTESLLKEAVISVGHGARLQELDVHYGRDHYDVVMALPDPVEQFPDSYNPYDPIEPEDDVLDDDLLGDSDIPGEDLPEAMPLQEEEQLVQHDEYHP